MKRNLILMTSVALIVLMCVSVLAITWPWQTTGKAIASTAWFGPYQLYEGKSRDINIGGEKYIISSQFISDSSVILNVNSEQASRVYQGGTVSIAGLEINIKKIYYSSKVGTKNYVTFTIKKSNYITSYGNHVVKQGDIIMLAKAYHRVDMVTTDQCLDIDCTETASLTTVRLYRVDAGGQTYQELGVGDSIILSGTSSVISNEKSRVKVTLFSIDSEKEEVDIGLAYYDSLVSSEPTSYAGVLEMIKDKCHVTGFSNLGNQNNGETCNNLCSYHNETCISGSFEEMGYISGQRVTFQTGDLIGCDYPMYTSNFGGIMTYSCMCCSVP